MPSIQIPGLDATASVAGSDLMHVRQGSQDFKVTVDVLANYINSLVDLTNLNASNLTSGTVPQSRLDANTLLALLTTVDGAGSLLDADLLDGLQGADYRNASNLNTGTVNNNRLTVSDEANFGIARKASAAQTAAGSLGSLYVSPEHLVQNVASNISATNGYIRLPPWLGGLRIQWGRQVTGLSSEGIGSVTFPTSFSSTPLCITTTVEVPDASATGVDIFELQVRVKSANNFTYFLQSNTGGPFRTSYINWIAIGT